MFINQLYLQKKIDVTTVLSFLYIFFLSFPNAAFSLSKTVAPPLQPNKRTSKGERVSERKIEGGREERTEGERESTREKPMTEHDKYTLFSKHILWPTILPPRYSGLA